MITKTILSFIKVLSSSLPRVHIKNISSIYLNQTNGWNFCFLKKTCLRLIHKYGEVYEKACERLRKRLWKFCSKGGSINGMMAYFMPKPKVVISENKFFHLYKHIKRNLFLLPKINWIFKNLQAIVWYTWIPAFHISCHHDRILSKFPHSLNLL